METPQSRQNIKLEAKIDKLATAIGGDPALGIPGMATDIKDIKKDLSEIKDRESKSFWKMAKLAFSGGIVGGAVGVSVPKSWIAKILAFWS